LHPVASAIRVFAVAVTTPSFYLRGAPGLAASDITVADSVAL
jgi:hypothetical protein